jgi:hypothetical protein
LSQALDMKNRPIKLPPPYLRRVWLDKSARLAIVGLHELYGQALRLGSRSK